MKIIANESQIETRRKIGERAPFIGLLVLAAATVLFFLRPGWLWATMVIVWIGFLISLTGTYLGDRYVGPNAHHKRVPEALKGLSNGYTLLMYQLPTPFVLVEPGGLTVITVKSQGGKVSFREGRWRHRQSLGFLRRFAGQESLGQPHKMAEVEREHLESRLGKRLPGEEEIPVRAVVLFSNPDVELIVQDEEVPIPALRAAELKRWLRKNPLRPQLSDETLKRVAEALDLDPEVFIA
ncbi:MAG: hypothetical protein ACP5HS_14345 [Anaerolineae bacterium]